MIKTLLKTKWKKRYACRWRLQLVFKLRDFWIGAYWVSSYNLGYESCSLDKSGKPMERVSFDLYVCLLPCLPIHYAWRHIHKENRDV